VISHLSSILAIQRYLKINLSAIIKSVLQKHMHIAFRERDIRFYVNLSSV